MAQADLGKVRLTDAELSDKIVQVNGGVRLGKDADGNAGYIVTDAETGADTVIPFKKGGSEEGVVLPASGTICFAGTLLHSHGGVSNIYLIDYFNNPINISEITKIETIFNINPWKTTTGGTVVGAYRKIYPVACVENSSGIISFILYDPASISIVSNTQSVSYSELKEEFNLSKISEYKNLLGFGIVISQYSGSGTSSIFKTSIGSLSNPNSGKMEYIIS